MFRILISLGITIIVSFSMGFVFKSLIGFWEGVVGAFIIQFLAFYVIAIQKKEDIEPTVDIASEIIDLQTVPVACPCGKHVITAPVFFNADNSFTCEKCGSKFKVEVSYDTVLLTEPLNIENVFNQLKDRELSDNKV